MDLVLNTATTSLSLFIGLGLLVFILFWLSLKSQFSLFKIFLLSGLFLSVTLLLWTSLKEPLPEPVASVAVPTSQELMLQIQNKLEADPNDAKLWFQLGQGYMNDYDFKSAATSFDYSLRLTLNPSANQYAALASALYYSKSQILSDDIQDLLDHALAQDSHNINALMLIASDHYVSFRYQKAIDSWQKILDSNKQEVDRARVINSINQAKGYL